MDSSNSGGGWPSGPMGPDHGWQSGFGPGNQPPPGAPMPNPAFGAPLPPGPPAGRGPGRRIALIGVAVLVAALVIGGVGVAIGVTISDSDPVEQARPTTTARPSAQDSREAARQAACDFTAIMTTYDYRDLESYKRSVDAGSTGTFKSDFDNTFPDLSNLMVTMQMSSTSSANECVYLTGNGKRAEVSVHADYTVTKAFEPAPRNERQSFTVTMERVDGRWLCSGMAPAEPK